MFRRDLLPPRPSHGRVAAWVVGVGVARAILTALYNALGDVQAGESGDFARRLADEFTALATAIPLFALVALGVARWPLGHAGWRRHLAPVAVLFVAYSVLHTLAMELLRGAVYPLLGGARDISPRALGLAMGHEMPNDLFYFALLVGCVELWRFWWAASERERREKALERSLAQAQLTALRLQLQPHFLFNALNTAIALVRVDPARAEAVLEDLSELFRAALADVGEATSLEAEVELARRYLEIEAVRFGERLQVQWFIDERAGRAGVPPLVLQPLVENAVRHGIEPSPQPGLVRVRTQRQRGQVVVTVSNTLGTDPDHPGNPGHGMALQNIRERLRLLHDVAAQCDVWREPGQGADAGRDWFHARIVLPAP